MRKIILTVVFLQLWCSSFAEVEDLTIEAIQSIPGLVGFWTFDEQAGENRVSIGPDSFELEEGNGHYDWYTVDRSLISEGPIERRSGGPISGSSAYLKPGQFFQLANAETGALNIYGADAQVTIVAFIKRAARDPQTFMQFVAGMWNESERRQYGLLINVPVSIPERGLLYPHVSYTGGTEGYPYCINYAANYTPVPMGEWVSVAMTYDGDYARSYLNGTFEARADGGYIGEAKNPYYYPAGLGNNGAKFTVGGHHVHGIGMYGTFVGQIDALLVFDRALTAQEIISIHELGDYDSDIKGVSDDFSNDTVPMTPSEVGWHVNAGPAGTNYDQTLERWWVAQYVGASVEKGYFVNQVVDEQSFIWRSSVETFDFETIKNIKFQTKNNSGQDKIHVAFKIEEIWYVSNEGFSKAEYKYQVGDWLTVEYDWTQQGSHFSELLLDEGIRLEIGDEVTGDLTGPISAFGLYCDGNISAIRFDSFEVNLNISSVRMPDVFVEQAGPSSLDLNFNSVEGVTYSLLVSDDLVEWFRAEEDSLEGDSQALKFTDEIRDKRFYKISLKESK